MFPALGVASIFSKSLPYLIVAGCVVGVLAGTYHMGKSSVQTKWDLEKAQTKLVIKNLQDKIEEATKEHETASKEVATHLRTEKEVYEKALSTGRSVTDGRLRESEKRADLYKRLSEGSTAERDRLRDHTAKLDRSLEEGRGVVGELKATVELRDKQLILLGQQMKLDGKLSNEPSQ